MEYFPDARHRHKDRLDVIKPGFERLGRFIRRVFGGNQNAPNLEPENVLSRYGQESRAGQSLYNIISDEEVKEPQLTEQELNPFLNQAKQNTLLYHITNDKDNIVNQGFRSDLKSKGATEEAGFNDPEAQQYHYFYPRNLGKNPLSSSQIGIPAQGIQQMEKQFKNSVLKDPVKGELIKKYGGYKQQPPFTKASNKRITRTYIPTKAQDFENDPKDSLAIRTPKNIPVNYVLPNKPQSNTDVLGERFNDIRGTLAEGVENLSENKMKKTQINQFFGSNPATLYNLLYNSDQEDEHFIPPTIQYRKYLKR